MDYILHKVRLSDCQKKNLYDAINKKNSLTLRISSENKNGDVPILLTKNQYNKLQTKKTGVDLKLSARQIQANKKEGGFLPFLLPIIAALGGLGGIAGGASAIANAVNTKNHNDRTEAETKRQC